MKETLIIYCLALVGFSFIVRLLPRTPYRWFFTILHGLWLTGITISCSNEHPLFITEETASLSLSKSFNRENKADAWKDFLGANEFILVDVSQDIQLLSSPIDQADPTHNSKVVGTNRQLLANFLNRFISDGNLLKKTDLIVCDILLDTPADPKSDSALATVMHQLASTNKLLMATTKKESACPSTLFSSVSRESGLIDIELHDGVFFSHQLLDDANRKTLPYSMYSLLYGRQPERLQVPGLGEYLDERKEQHGAKANISQGNEYGQNIFVPDLKLTEESIQQMGNTENEPTNYTAVDPWLRTFFQLFGHSSAGRSGFSKSQQFLMYYKLGYMASQEPILTTLMDDSGKKKNIVFIGIFQDQQRDVHQTAFGPMHGSIILLNIYLNLVNKGHILTVSYLAFLFIAFCIITNQMIRVRLRSRNDLVATTSKLVWGIILSGLKLICYKVSEEFTYLGKRIWGLLRFKLPKCGTIQSVQNGPKADHLRSSTIRDWVSQLQVLRETLHPLISQLTNRALGRVKIAWQIIILDQRHYWLLFGMLYVSINYFNHVINVMGLVIYTAAVDFSLRILTAQSKARTARSESATSASQR